MSTNILKGTSDKMNNSLIRMFVLICTIVGCNKNYLPLKTVDEVDIQKYTGIWYEIVRLPNRFQKDCFGAMAEYEIIDETTIKVTNSCYQDSINGELEQVTGKAFIEDLNEKSKLKVQFFWPFKGDYWIIGLDQKNYNFTLVGTPSREYFWILGRSQVFEKSVLDSLLEFAEKEKFDVSKLIYEPSIEIIN